MISTTNRFSTVCDGWAAPFEPEPSSPSRRDHRAPAAVVAVDPGAAPACAESASGAGSGFWHWHGGSKSLYTPKAARQVVFEQEPEKIPARHGADMILTFVILIAETDLAITDIDDVLFWQNAAIDVPTQIEQRLQATPSHLAVNHPISRQGLLAVKTCQGCLKDDHEVLEAIATLPSASVPSMT
jgi:hypothetical protein